MAKVGRSKRVLTAIACVGGLFSGCNGDQQAESTQQIQQEAVLGPCAKHADCEDGNPCTQNLCALGLCLVPVPVLGCCFNGQCGTAGTAGTAGVGGSAAGTGGTAGTTAGTGGTTTLGCSVDAQCQDGNPCTQDLCLVGLCLPLPVVGCCYQGVCQDDGSAGAGGESPIVTGGCSTNEQCDDGNDCTQNLCVLGLCTTLPVLGCDGTGGSPPVLGCSTNEECEDDNDCIQNLCLLGLCAALPVIGGVCGGDGGTAGTGGTAGSANGGTAGTAGNSGSANGGTAGTAGNGGAFQGGEAGAPGPTMGGSDATSGGDSGDAGSSNPNGGTSTGATNTGATTAAAGDAGARGDVNPPRDWAMQGGACGCKAVGAPTPPTALSLLLAALTALTIRARSRKPRIASNP